MAQPSPPFWAIPSHQELRQLETTSRGLTSESARQRLARSGPNPLTPRRRANALVLLLSQFKSPIMVLLYVYHATVDQFRTGWFVESVLTELLIMLVIRTQKPFFQIRPGRSLALATVIVAVVTLLLPYSPFGALLGFTPLSLLALIGGIAVLYILATELAKRLFYQHVAW
jgi:magnesium-transporting ATPase (P-type)